MKEYKGVDTTPQLGMTLSGYASSKAPWKKLLLQLHYGSTFPSAQSCFLYPSQELFPKALPNETPTYKYQSQLCFQGNLTYYKTQTKKNMAVVIWEVSMS